MIGKYRKYLDECKARVGIRYRRIESMRDDLIDLQDRINKEVDELRALQRFMLSLENDINKAEAIDERAFNESTGDDNGEKVKTY